MRSAGDEFKAVWDLGEEWLKETGLPFVFAMWVARKGAADSPEAARLFSEARDRGLANLTEIAEREAPRVGLSPAVCLSYLRDNLHFTLGREERRGLALFHRLAARIGCAGEHGLLAFAGESLS
jgi:chorismate dehydratase